MRRTELIVNGTSIDIEDEISLPITYAVAELKDPSKRSGSFSKTVKLPGSPSVDKIFTRVFEINYSIQNVSTVNFTPDFNPNLKASIVVRVDTIEQFRGYLRLRSIERTRQSLDKLTYNVELFGELGNLIQLWGDSKLTDLNFSEYDHTYNRTNQKASWSGSYLTGYFYPMIQYGLNDGVNWSVEHFFPAIYVRQYWDKMFDYIGQYYTGSFCSATLFKKLVIPFTGESFKLSQSSVNNRKFVANKNSASSDFASTWLATFGSPAQGNFPSTIDTFIFNTETSDPDGQYNPANGVFTCVSPGYYEFATSGIFSWSASGGDVTAVSGNHSSLRVFIYKYESATGLVTLLNGASIENSFSSILDGNSSSSVSYTYTSDTTLLEVGDQITIMLIPNPLQITSGSSFLRFKLNKAPTFYNTIRNAAIVEGGTVDLNSAVPNDIRIADFFLSIVKEFNLMVEPVRTMPNTFTIETADTFYSGGTNRDWSNKLDLSKTVEVLPMGALDSRRYVLKRKDSDDYFNKAYREEFGETYGMKKYDVNNDFLKDINVFESIFYDTPLVGRTSDDRVYPEIWTTDSSGNPKPTTGGIRMLYAGGAIATNFAWNYITDGGTFSETTYPYAGHLDSVSAPTVDLSFDEPNRVYYNTTVYTDANLFNVYHSKFIEEITNKNSKILIGYFYLKPLDILQLSFRDRIYLDIAGVNAYYRLQKIIDYDPTKEQVTKVELLKIKNAAEFVSNQYTIGNWLDGTGVQTAVPPRSAGGTSGSTVSAGEGNYSAQRNMGSIIGGYKIRLGDGAERIGIIGSSGIDVYPEVKNAVAIGSSNKVLDEDNLLWIGDIRYPNSDDSFTKSATESITNPGMYLVSGTITLTLPSPALYPQSEWVFLKTDILNTVTISGGGVNINGAATTTLVTQYSKITIKAIGNQFYITA